MTLLTENLQGRLTEHLVSTAGGVCGNICEFLTDAVKRHKVVLTFLLIVAIK